MNQFYKLFVSIIKNTIYNNEMKNKYVVRIIWLKIYWNFIVIIFLLEFYTTLCQEISLQQIFIHFAFGKYLKSLIK